MKKIVALALVLLAVYLIYSFFKGPSYANLPPTNGSTWIAFGDSLTSGIGASPDHDYPTLLGKRIGTQIANLGIPGNTTGDGLNRLDEVLQLNPKVVFLCLGGNDSLQGAPAQPMFQNLGALIYRMQQSGCFVVLLGIRSASILDRNEAGFRSLAKQRKVLYVPNILKGILGNPSLMSDQVHPNDEGYDAIAERIERALQPVLPKLRN
jgi:acyl-CoA thioesterase-1